MDSRLQQQRSDASSPPASQQSHQHQQQQRPLLGDLARSTGTGTGGSAAGGAGINPAQAARRTFAGGASAAPGSGHPASGSTSRAHHHYHRQHSHSSSGHQSQLRTAAASVVPATAAAAAAASAPSSGGGSGSAAAAAAAASVPSSSNNPPSRTSARRHHSATNLTPSSSSSSPTAAAVGAPSPSSSSSSPSQQLDAHHRSASAYALGESGRGGSGAASGTAPVRTSTAAAAAASSSTSSSSSARNLRLDQNQPELAQHQRQMASSQLFGGGLGNVDPPTSAVQRMSISRERSSSPTTSKSKKGWTVVETTSGLAGGVPPCQRSLHAAAVLHTSMYCFGGYDGTSRVNDFHSYSFAERRWSPVLPSASSGPPPSPRDRHVALVHGNCFYVFGGFDGTSRVSDFFGFDFSSMTWRQILPRSGNPPSPRHSHSAVVYGDSMFVFGGYDGSYRADFHEFNFTTGAWTPIPTAGRAPRARYRATCVVHQNTMVLFGGHDGTRHLADTHIFDFDTRVWTAVLTDGTPPIPRDSHVSVVHGDSMYVFGGSTGSAMNDLLELRLPTSTSRVAKWRTIDTSPSGEGATSAGHRFCHVAVTYGNSMYVFGGYDGSNRLNDFIRFDFDVEELTCEIPPSTLVSDLRSFLHDDALSDITFIVEGQPVHAHKVMLMRCSYFRAMFLGEMMESGQSEIRLEQVRHSVFLPLLEYLYTDTVEIPLEIAMELFVAADQFGVPRLQAMCEKKMLESITVESAATIFLAADLHSAESLRSKSLKYILSHFEAVSKTQAFEEMARGNVELVFEILKNR